MRAGVRAGVWASACAGACAGVCAGACASACVDACAGTCAGACAGWLGLAWFADAHILDRYTSGQDTDRLPRHKEPHASRPAERHSGGVDLHVHSHHSGSASVRARSPQFLVTTPIHEGPISRGLGHVSSALAYMHANTPTGVWPLHVPRFMVRPRAQPLRRQAAALLRVFARHHPIHPAICCRSHRGYGAWRRRVRATAAVRGVVAWRGGSQGFCRYSHLAALLRAERPIGACDCC